MGIIGCSNKAQEYKMVSEQKGKYSVYVIGDGQVSNKLDKETMNSIFRMESNTDYQDAKKEAPFLKIEDGKPNYFLFDSKDLKYQTTSFEKLVEYIKNNPNPK
jgi:hypothetical protein